MKVLTEDAVLMCEHGGRISNQPTQDFVTIEQRQVLVENNPEGRTILSCPNVGPTIKPCQLTLKVSTGYSAFIRVDGHPLCLGTITGLTDGTPPGVVKYNVRSPGQELVSVKEAG